MRKLLSLALLFLVLAAGSALLYFADSPTIEAAGDFLLSGWAWSSNIGWVNFGNFDPPSNPDYGVRINSETGEFSGYAWSGSCDPVVGCDPANPIHLARMGGIGWVRFDPAGPYPEAPQYSAKIAVSGGRILDGEKVLGWARACGVFKSGCDGDLKATSSLGGWDGWAKLTGKTQDGKDYGVKKVTDGNKEKLVGLSWPNEPKTLGVWAGDNIGWLSFYEVLISAKGQPPIFTADCSTSVQKAGIGEYVDWTVSVSGGTKDYRYCWGGDGQNKKGCTPPLNDDVHLETTHPIVKSSYTISRSFNIIGDKTGKAKVLDSNNQEAFCSATVKIEDPGQQPPTVDLLANGQKSVTIATSTPLYMTWTATNNPDKCVASDGFGGWKDKEFNYPGVKNYDIIPPPPHPLGDYTFKLTCSNSYGQGFNKAEVTVKPAGAGESELEVIDPGVIRILLQPLGEPGVSQPTKVLNNKVITPPGKTLKVCLNDVISRKDPTKSLAKPNGGIFNLEPTKDVPRCWLSTDPVPPDPDKIKGWCYDKSGEPTCMNLAPGASGNLAIKILEPLGRVSSYQPYNISFLVDDNPVPASAKVIFEYLVSKFKHW